MQSTHSAKGAAKDGVSRKKKMSEAKLLDEGTEGTVLIIQSPIGHRKHFKDFGFYATGNDRPER